MKSFRFLVKTTVYTCGKLCRQYLLLAGLVLLCLFLPGMLGRSAEALLMEGVDFSGITLAVTAPENDPIPALLEEFMGHMKDISRYCSFRAMDREEAIRSLAAGDVVAVLELPENFVAGILDGSNPDVTLIVDSNRPVESLLTLWVGQSAADLLSAVQSGIYAVLQEYDASGSTLPREQVVTAINLRYVNWTLNRQDVFQTQTLRATGTLSVKTHYAISLLIWLCLSLAPLFFPVYQDTRLISRRRLRCVGISGSLCCLSDLTACMLILLPILLLSFTAIFPDHLPAAFLWALATGSFCALFGSFCCLITGSAARCGGLSFLLSLAGLFLAGGILPPVMLPETLQRLRLFSPVTWLRSLAEAMIGYNTSAIALTVLSCAFGLMLLLTLLLYRRRMDTREVAV